MLTAFNPNSRDWLTELSDGNDGRKAVASIEAISRAVTNDSIASYGKLGLSGRPHHSISCCSSPTQFLV